MRSSMEGCLAEEPGASESGENEILEDFTQRLIFLAGGLAMVVGQATLDRDELIHRLSSFLRLERKPLARLE